MSLLVTNLYQILKMLPFFKFSKPRLKKSCLPYPDYFVLLLLTLKVYGIYKPFLESHNVQCMHICDK